MTGLIQLAIIAVIVVILARHFGIGDPRRLFASTTRVVGMGLMVVAAGMIATGRVAAGFGVGLFAASLIGWDLRSMVLGAILGGGQPAPSPSPKSTWRTVLIEVSVDLRDGAMTGRVLAGRFRGKALSDLGRAELLALRGEMSSDPTSLGLAEAYLDRRMPRWREDLKGDPAAGQGRPARPSAMSEKEAYEILGLQPGAGEAEIGQAYRRLMKAVHPDAGGSAFLAGRVNEARDRLIGKH